MAVSFTDNKKMGNKKYIAIITYPDKRGHKATIYASGMTDALERLVKEYGVGQNGIGCTITEEAEE